MTVNELISILKDRVDAEDRDHVEIRLVIHDDDGSTTAYAESTSGGTGYPFVNIVSG